MPQDQILAQVSEHYLSSQQFNGLPASSIVQEFGIDSAMSAIEELVRQQLISLNFRNYHPNPHIKALPASPPDEQIARMRDRGLGGACVYPEPAYLRQVVDVHSYQDAPYTLALALGDAQLSYRSFDLAVLERYRNDPRYRYQNDDISGSIGITDEFYGEAGAPERDKIGMQTFGFCFDLEENCYVAAFLRYLTGLSPEHQQFWAGQEVDAETQLHPDYFRPSFLGEFPERVSIYTATLMEIRTINELARAIGRPAFFRQDFSDDRKPTHFGRLVRPTAHEFAQFVLTLDRMLSDNISLAFFGEDVLRESEVERPDGRIEVQRKGSIQMLSDWIAGVFAARDQESSDTINEMLETLKAIRRLRMRPAHALDDDAFRQEVGREQRELMQRTYRSLKTIRLLLANHPLAANAEVPAPIEEGRIWSL